MAGNTVWTQSVLRTTFGSAAAIAAMRAKHSAPSIARALVFTMKYTGERR